jgi:GDSL-like Lipase/Acylhydrolase family
MHLPWKFLVAPAAPCLALGATELIVRRIDRWSPPMPMPGPLPIRSCADPRIRFENRPGAVQTLRYVDRAGGVREVTVAVNAQGTRGEEIPTRKPPGTIRVVVLGDSQTFGAGVPAEGTWPAVVGAMLRKATDHPRIEVMNCAVAGYDADQSAAALETRWLAFDPDLVLLGYFVNDPPVPPGASSSGTSPVGRRLLAAVTPGSRSLVSSLRRSSALLDVMSDGLYRHLRGREWANQADFLHSDASPSWAETKAALRRERDLCRAHGASFGVVLLPFLVPWGDGLISSVAYRRVAEFCASAEIPAYDPEPLFHGRDLTALLVHEKDFHSGTEAHRMEGEAVAAWVLRRGLLGDEFAGD